jgi:hypothetical protein
MRSASGSTYHNHPGLAWRHHGWPRKKERETEDRREE